MNNTIPVDLSKYDNAWFRPGSKWRCVLWYYTNLLVIKNSWNPFSGLRIFFLKIFGAQIGTGVVIKPGVSIKYPWKLSIGHHTWIGENVWIDNLDTVRIGDHVCISQGALLLTGNHNYTTETFDLMLAPITIASGAWIGAKSIVCPGVVVQSHAVLTVGSLAQTTLETYGIYKGHPALMVKKRTIIK